MYTCKELKVLSKEQLKGNWLKVILAMIIIGVISSGVSFVLDPRVSLLFSHNYEMMMDAGANNFSNTQFFGMIIQIILLLIFSYSVSKIILDISLKNNVKFGDIFYGVKNFGAAFKTFFRVYLFTFFWTLLFIIPGIIKGLSYSFAPFIKIENPNISSKEAIETSKKLTYGKKELMFVLGLYLYIPLILLGAIIGFFGMFMLAAVSDSELKITIGAAVLMIVIGIPFYIITLIYYVGLANIYNQAKKEKQNENS